MVKKKIKTNKNRNLDNKIAVLEDFKNEIQNRLDIKNQNLSILEQNNRVIEKYSDINPFDFSDNDQHDDEINLNEFLDLAEKNRTKYDRTPVFDVIVDSQQDNYPFILNAKFLINNGEPSQFDSLIKDSDQLTKPIEKMIGKYDETLKVLFSGYMIKYTMVSNEINRSNHGKGCGSFNNFSECEGLFCYIPNGNACFRNC